MKYAYDPRKAMQLIEEVGMRKGPDGKYRQPDGRMASIEIQATTNDINSKSMAMIQTLSVGVSTGRSMHPPTEAIDSRLMK